MHHNQAPVVSVLHARLPVYSSLSCIPTINNASPPMFSTRAPRQSNLCLCPIVSIPASGSVMILYPTMCCIVIGLRYQLSLLIEKSHQAMILGRCGQFRSVQDRSGQLAGCDESKLSGFALCADCRKATMTIIVAL
jgi:hypothetical protein